MDQSRVVKRLLAKYDLASEVGRKRAYQKCEDYADEHFPGRVEYNAFMEAVADKLGMPSRRKVSFAKEIGDVPENGKLHMTYVSQVGPELTGNAEGLRCLAALVAELAKQAIEHDHAHLYADSPPMWGDTYPLTIYHEPNAWFEQLGAEEEKESQIAARDIDPSDIVALCVLGEIPPDMLLTKRRLYRVLSVKAYKGQKVWEKRIRDEDERLFLFTLINDEGAHESFGFDLDDPELLPFSRREIAEVCGARRRASETPKRNVKGPRK